MNIQEIEAHYNCPIVERASIRSQEMDIKFLLSHLAERNAELALARLDAKTLRDRFHIQEDRLATQTERVRLLERRADSAEELIIQLESGENQHQSGCTKQPPCSCGLDIKRLQWQKDANKWAQALKQESLGDWK